MLLLRLTRQHKIQVKCNPVPADLKSITDSALDVTKGFLTNRDISFKIQREETKIPNVLVDPVRLRDVLVNILSNAVKFTPDGKNIPIIAMTANSFGEDVQASLDAGMNAHLSKPIVIDEVIKTILRYVDTSTFGTRNK